LLYIDFTGKGWITYALVPLTFLVGITLGLSLDSSPDVKYRGAGIAAVIVAVVGGVAQWVTGRALNGDAARRGWDQAEHTTYGIPMELTAPFYPVVGLVMLSFVVGSVTSALWGWLLFLSVVAVAVVLVREARRRRVVR
jgi:hypothetical protein